MRSGTMPHMIIVGLIVVALVVIGIFALIIFGGLFKIERDQNASERDADRLLGEAFDGRADVTYKINMRSMKYETVIAGAKERGYTLTHQAGDPNRAMILMFEVRHGSSIAATTDVAML